MKNSNRRCHPWPGFPLSESRTSPGQLRSIRFHIVRYSFLLLLDFLKIFQIYLMHLFSLPFPAIENVSSATCPPTFSYFKSFYSWNYQHFVVYFTSPSPIRQSIHPSIRPPSRRRAAIALLRDGRGASLRPALPRIPTAANIEAQLSPVHATQSHLRSDQPRRSTSSRGSCMMHYYYDLLSFIRLVQGKREQRNNTKMNRSVFISLNISQVQRPSRNKKTPALSLFS